MYQASKVRTSLRYQYASQTHSSLSLSLSLPLSYFVKITLSLPLTHFLSFSPSLSFYLSLHITSFFLNFTTPHLLLEGKRNKE